MLRYLVTALPVLTIAGVSWLVLVVGAERPLAGVRVWGGPSDGLARFSAWIQVDDPVSAARAGDVVRVEARAAHGESASAKVSLDRDARGQLRLDFSRPPARLEVRVASAERVLGTGQVELTRAAWLDRVRRLGGPAAARAEGLSVSVAPLRGVFAVPFPGELVGRVEWEGRGSAAAAVTLSADGGVVTPERTISDARGNFAVTLRPSEHIVTLRVGVQAQDGKRAELFTSLPVLPGAILVERRGRELVVTSPIERAMADVSLVSEAGRWFGARIPLTAQGDGRATGSLPMPELAEARLWAVVSSDAASASAAVVGWPLFAESPRAERTFDAVDRLLLDTRPAQEAAERERRRGVRRWALLVALVGATASAVVLLISSGRARTTSLSRLAQELGEGPSQALVPGRSARAFLALGLVLLGFLAVASIAAWRLV